MLAPHPFSPFMPERAIGVIDLPQTERERHDFRTWLAHRFDAVFHPDETGAVEPLDAPRHCYQREEPEQAT